MKSFVKLFSVAVIILLIFSPDAYSQVRDPVDATKDEGENRVNRGIDRTIDKGFDKLEEGIGGIFKKKKKDKSADEEAEPVNEQQKENVPATAVKETGPSLNWAKYDFVPGDQVIFEDNLAGEENGEFPSRWDLHDGTVEMAVLDGENVIMFREYGSTIVPYMKDPESDYLPDIFTVEFDAYIPHDHIQVIFYDMKNQSAPHQHAQLYVTGHGMELNPASSDLPGKINLEKNWIHVAIAYTSGKMKAYINETRLINLPRLSFDPAGISIRALHSGDESHYYIKNIRIAKGGVKYYDRFLQEGKIIANGIRFDVNKATLKPESMGVINEIATMMKEHPEIRFSVEGHTDSDGDDAFNMNLSEERANTVKNKLIEMGISAERLSSKGWGESKPISGNTSPEDKANNRRVEFVKI
ncbi:MAG: OmpA family protein [Bacteroidales bacterium]|jgi:outer membrane protein OmpA-like peptidoglycan-associated protein|nr:OmpA family protein [Bacteroidales bacterium]